jgi:hypothetical protein
MPKTLNNKDWWKDLAIAIIATTVSIILTFGTASLVNRHDQKKERKLTALMVMSSIESFARGLDESVQAWDRIDSIAAWMLQLPIEDIARLGDEPFEDAIQEVFQTPILRHDKTAETIFSSNIDTWKNMGNFQFVDNVGACFSQMNWIEDTVNEESKILRDHQGRIYDNPPAYPGNSLVEKLMRDTQMRQQLLNPHSIKEWLSYCAAEIRRMNRKNMKLIDISEEEVLKFTEARADVADEVEETPDYSTFQHPYPRKETLDNNLDYARQINELLKK